MTPKNSVPRKSKKQVEIKRAVKKPPKKSFEQKIYIGPGPYCEKPPKG